MTDVSPELSNTLAGAVNLAIERQQAGDVAGAEALYLKVLSVDGANPVALHNLGLIRLQGGDSTVALELLMAAVRLRPQEPVFHFNLAIAYQQTNRLSDAQNSYQTAVRLNPAYRVAWENLGVVLQDSGSYDEAAAAYRRALTLDPCSLVAHKNLIAVLRAQGRPEQARQQCIVALDCEPVSSLIGCQLGAILLSVGDYASGWKFHEWRYWEPEALESAPPHRVPLPKWDGCSLVGKKIVACGEEGIGDEIMFASCVPDLAEQADAVLLVCAPRLVPLFARSFPGVEVRAAQDKVTVLEREDSFDFRIALPSLPQHLRTAADSFDGRFYLKADPESITRWRERLDALGTQPKIGISWRGGLNPRDRVARSLDLQQLQAMLCCADVTFIDVQYGDHADEVSRLVDAGGRVPLSLPDVDPLRDMDDFAALLSALDLVISVDNSTVHLAGALGVPTWLLLPSLADWRWGVSGERSVWYESVRVWRQEGCGAEAWTSLLADVVRQIEAGIHVRSSDSAVSSPIPAKTGTATAPGARRAVLLNDTSYWYHWGCTCTSLALHQGLRAAGYVVEGVPIMAINRLQPLPERLDDFDSDTFFERFCSANSALIDQLRRCDVVAVNGEGTLHGLGASALALLYLSYVAKCRLGKNTQVINHSCYPVDGTVGDGALAEDLYRKVYAALDRVVVREPESAAVLARLGVRVVDGFDCLPLFARAHLPAVAARTRRVVLCGTVALSQDFISMMVGLAQQALAAGYELDILVGANAYMAHDDVLFVNALHRHLRGRYRLVAATSETQWLETIRDAALLISGRFHHTIAAAWLGTPFLVSASNTAKIDGLLARLDITTSSVWISPSRADDARVRLDALLQAPGDALISTATRTRLIALAEQNFRGFQGLFN